MYRDVPANAIKDESKAFPDAGSRYACALCGIAITRNSAINNTDNIAPPCVY